MSKILVTGGAGFIGSHSCVALLEAGYEIVVVDNLSNAKEEALRRVRDLTGKDLTFYPIDIRDRDGLVQIFQHEKIEAVIHFAALKAVGESVSQPLAYYHNNVYGTVTLLQVMDQFDCKKMVFSSSATVYGEPHAVPITEDFPLRPPTNPYGRTKLMVEDILRDLYIADTAWHVTLLRYFNPIGAHQSGRIGEDPNGIPTNLTPYITQAAIGKYPHVNVWGSDYNTHDGTGVRDYIHVVDLAKGHVKALNKLGQKPGVKAYNLGTGVGYSVLDVIAAFEKAVGQSIPYQLGARRPGDIDASYADPTKAKLELDWVAELSLDEMCRDAWRWQALNPQGYA